MDMAMAMAMTMAVNMAPAAVTVGGRKGMAKPFNKYHTIFYNVYCLGIGIVMPIKYFLFIFNILSILLRSFLSFHFVFSSRFTTMTNKMCMIL